MSTDRRGTDALTGRVVVDTRRRAKGHDRPRALDRLGARVLYVPAIRCEVTEDSGEWREHIARAEEFDLVVFTSAMAVEAVEALSTRDGIDLDPLRRLRIACLGQQTASALQSVGLAPDGPPSDGGAANLASELTASERVQPGERVLFPCSRRARPELPRALELAGVEVSALALYDTHAGRPEDAAELLAEHRRGTSIDAILLASPSGLDGLRHMTGDAAQGLLESSALISIGPTTSAAIRAAGFPVAAEAERPEEEELARAVVRGVGSRT